MMNKAEVFSIFLIGTFALCTALADVTLDRIPVDILESDTPGLFVTPPDNAPPFDAGSLVYTNFTRGHRYTCWDYLALHDAVLERIYFNFLEGWDPDYTNRPGAMYWSTLENERPQSQWRTMNIKETIGRTSGSDGPYLMSLYEFNTNRDYRLESRMLSKRMRDAVKYSRDILPDNMMLANATPSHFHSSYLIYSDDAIETTSAFENRLLEEMRDSGLGKHPLQTSNNTAFVDWRGRFNPTPSLYSLGGNLYDRHCAFYCLDNFDQPGNPFYDTYVSNALENITGYFDFSTNFLSFYRIGSREFQRDLIFLNRYLATLDQTEFGPGPSQACPAFLESREDAYFHASNLVVTLDVGDRMSPSNTPAHLPGWTVSKLGQAVANISVLTSSETNLVEYGSFQTSYQGPTELKGVGGSFSMSRHVTIPGATLKDIALHAYNLGNIGLDDAGRIEFKISKTVYGEDSPYAGQFDGLAVVPHLNAEAVDSSVEVKIEAATVFLNSPSYSAPDKIDIHVAMMPFQLRRTKLTGIAAFPPLGNHWYSTDPGLARSCPPRIPATTVLPFVENVEMQALVKGYISCDSNYKGSDARGNSDGELDVYFIYGGQGATGSVAANIAYSKVYDIAREYQKNVNGGALEKDLIDVAEELVDSMQLAEGSAPILIMNVDTLDVGYSLLEDAFYVEGTLSAETGDNLGIPVAIQVYNLVGVTGVESSPSNFPTAVNFSGEASSSSRIKWRYRNLRNKTP